MKCCNRNERLQDKTLLRYYNHLNNLVPCITHPPQNSLIFVTTLLSLLVLTQYSFTPNLFSHPSVPPSLMAPQVRKAALLMANAAAHHNPDLIAPYVAESVAPHLWETLQFKQERVVDLGPFKHKVREGSMTHFFVSFVEYCMKTNHSM